MKARDEYYSKFIACLIMAGVFSIGAPLLLPAMANISIVTSLLWGLGFGVMFLLVAWANYAAYKSDLNRELTKDQRIKQLEEENRKLKNQQ